MHALMHIIKCCNGCIAFFDAASATVIAQKRPRQVRSVDPSVSGIGTTQIKAHFMLLFLPFSWLTAVIQVPVLGTAACGHVSPRDCTCAVLLTEDV